MQELDFNINSVQATEFGVGRKRDSSQIFESVPVDNDVKDELLKYAHATLSAMEKYNGVDQEYDPSDEAASSKYIYLPLSSEMAEVFKDLQNTENLRKTPNPFNIDNTFCYFAQFIDKDGRRLTAVRKPYRFKSLGKGLISWIDGTLKPIPNPVFKLETIFDLFIDSKHVHILHPKSFESIGNLEDFIFNSVEKNIKIIQDQLQFVDLEPIKDHAAEHIRTARCLASIRMRGWAENIDKDKLKRECIDNNVKINESGNLLDISGNINGFLEILDRRRYKIELGTNMPERFRAANRHKINL